MGFQLGLVHPHRLHGTSIRARTSTQITWDFSRASTSTQITWDFSRTRTSMCVCVTAQVLSKSKNIDVYDLKW